MSKSIIEALHGKNGNYILPFLWMRGEDESVLREEMGKIDDCGIKAVCLESRPHPEFAGPLWWRDFDVILDEAKKRGMKIWILDDAHFPTGMANGLLPKKYPERAKQYVSVKAIDVAGPVVHGTIDIPYNLKKSFSFMDLGKPMEPTLVQEERLLAIVAHRLLEEDTIGTEYQVLWTADGCPDTAAQPDEAAPAIRAEIRDNYLICDVPEGVYRILLVHTTYDEGSRNDYINIIDEDSVKVLIEAVYEQHYERYKEEFGKTIAGFFSDEPGFGNTFGYNFDEAIGRRMMPLPWNKEMPGMLEERLGAGYKELLPALWYPLADAEKTAKIRYAYMDAVTRLYQKNFSQQLGKWCSDHDVEYIGHVIEDNGEHSRLGCGAGHYFRAISGQAMAGIDNIGGQVIPGNPDSFRHGFNTSHGPFFHYTISKLGASAALFQSAKKGRLMCETFGAYGWSLGVRDMKWVADHLISRGINYLVPHAFSMAEYPDTDCPPHFYARGNNPEFSHFADLMKYCNRMCHVFSGGKWQPEVGILYDGTLDWMSESMRDEVPGKLLYDNLIDYAIVPADALAVLSGSEPNTEEYEAEVKNGRFVLGGVPLKVLVVPGSRFADPLVAEFIQKYPEVKVLFVEPVAASYGEVQHTSLSDLVPTLKELGVVGARTNFNGAVSFYHYRKDAGDLWMVFNEDRSRTMRGDLLIRMKDENRRIYKYDALSNRVSEVEQIKASGFDTPVMICTVTLDPYESTVLFSADDEEAAAWRGTSLAGGEKESAAANFDEVRQYIPDWPITNLKHRIHGEPRCMLTISDLTSGWEVSTLTSTEYNAGAEWKSISGEIYAEEEYGTCLKPVSDLMPAFSGYMKYKREIQIDNIGGNFCLQAEHLYECARVYVNGKEVASRMCSPYRFDLSNAFQLGTNTLEVIVVNTPLRDVLNHDQGMWGYQKGIYEPSGMFGRIRLIHCEEEKVS